MWHPLLQQLNSQTGTLWTVYIISYFRKSFEEAEFPSQQEWHWTYYNMYPWCDRKSLEGRTKQDKGVYWEEKGWRRRRKFSEERGFQKVRSKCLTERSSNGKG